MTSAILFVERGGEDIALDVRGEVLEERGNPFCPCVRGVEICPGSPDITLGAEETEEARSQILNNYRYEH